jgi:uncharacterized protein (UPF0210 family)
VNIGTTRKAGINMDAVARWAAIIKQCAAGQADRGGLGCAKLVVFCNAVEDNPFMAGAFHGIGEPECVINVGVSGPGVVLRADRTAARRRLRQLASIIKRTAFKVTRMGELVGREASERLGVPFGIVDLSLAPTPAQGDSVARILEAMGLERVGTHGSTAALALLNDAVKKGGAMASSTSAACRVRSSRCRGHRDDRGGRAGRAELRQARSDDLRVLGRARHDRGAGRHPRRDHAAIIADEAAIGMINRKTTAVRVIPVPGKGVGDRVEFGGLLGRAPIMPVTCDVVRRFVARGGRIPAPLQALNN